jgi:hypothetical protein
MFHTAVHIIRDKYSPLTAESSGAIVNRTSLSDDIPTTNLNVQRVTIYNISG